MKTQFNQLIVSTIAVVISGCGGGGGGDKGIEPTSKNTPAYEQYVVSNATQINSLTDTDNTSDLAKITAHFSDKRIVQLGESSHGSMQMSQIKTRLIKYLHQNHDYNVIAFESSMFSCNLKLEPHIESATHLLRSCIFGVWQSHEVLELFDYIIETQDSDRPLKLAGFDIQFSGGYGFSSLNDYFNQVISQYKLTPEFDLDTLFQRYRKTSDAGMQCRADNSSQLCDQFDNEFLDTMASLELITQYFESLGNDFILPSAIAKSQQLSLLMSKARIEEGPEAAIKIRDTGMAENFITLADTVFPYEKIMIWAHNFHIAESYPSDMHQVKFMGGLLDEHFSDQLYSVGLYMLSGESANNNRTPRKVHAHEADSLESIVQATSLAPLFLPLSKENQSSPDDDWLHIQTKAKQWGQGNSKLVLSDNYDALIVIDESSMPDYLIKIKQ